jgi:hypothetical protein
VFYHPIFGIDKYGHASGNPVAFSMLLYLATFYQADNVSEIVSLLAACVLYCPENPEFWVIRRNSFEIRGLPKEIAV